MVKNKVKKTKVQAQKKRKFPRKKKFFLQTQKHPFHILSSSPLPFMVSLCVLVLALGFVEYMHFSLIFNFIVGLLLLVCVSFMWFFDVIKEGTFGGYHTSPVVENLRLGFMLFVLTEVAFFASFFWSFFHFSLAPSIFIGMQWPPEGLVLINPMGLPFFNTILLLYSSYLVTYAHKSMIGRCWRDSQIGLFLAIICGVFFFCVQGYEYIESPFSINDSVYGSIFYILTGCHGLHVLIGTIFLTVCFVRNELKHFTCDHHVGFEAAAIYWHFVDVVWIFVYLFVYCWSAGNDFFRGVYLFFSDFFTLTEVY